MCVCRERQREHRGSEANEDGESTGLKKQFMIEQFWICIYSDLMRTDRDADYSHQSETLSAQGRRETIPSQVNTVAHTKCIMEVADTM